MSESTVPARLAVGDPAPALTLLDTTGRPIALASLWAQRPALVALLRHFG